MGVILFCKSCGRRRSFSIFLSLLFFDIMNERHTGKRKPTSFSSTAPKRTRFEGSPFNNPDELPLEQLVLLFNATSTQELQKLISWGFTKEEAIERVLHKLKTQKDHTPLSRDRLVSQFDLLTLTEADLQTISTIHTEVRQLRRMGMNTSTIVRELLSRLQQSRTTLYKRPRGSKYSETEFDDSEESDEDLEIKKQKFDDSPTRCLDNDLIGLSGLLRKRQSRFSDSESDGGEDQPLWDPSKKFRRCSFTFSDGSPSP